MMQKLRVRVVVFEATSTLGPAFRPGDRTAYAPPIASPAVNGGPSTAP